MDSTAVIPCIVVAVAQGVLLVVLVCEAVRDLRTRLVSNRAVAGVCIAWLTAWAVLACVPASSPMVGSAPPAYGGIAESVPLVQAAAGRPWEALVSGLAGAAAVSGFVLLCGMFVRWRTSTGRTHGRTKDADINGGHVGLSAGGVDGLTNGGAGGSFGSNGADDLSGNGTDALPIGGGDIKLLCAIGLYMGIELGMYVLLGACLIAVLGVVGSTLVGACARALKRRRAPRTSPHSPSDAPSRLSLRRTFPFVPSLAVSTGIVTVVVFLRLAAVIL
jgi:Flp pilus assembly protein protease CpaA